MHRSALLPIGLALLLGAESYLHASPAVAPPASTCAVDNVYQRIQPPPGTLATTMLGGDAMEVQELYVLARINTGSYDISLTRKSTNLYMIDGKDLFVRTRYCYQYAYGQRAILDMASREIVFR